MINPVNFISNIDINSVISYIISDRVQETLFPLRVAFLAVSGILAGLIILSISRAHYMQWLFVHDWVQFISMKPLGTKKITRQWNKITDRLKTASESEYKLAIIEADDLMDVILKKMGYEAPTIEEKLGKITSVALSNIEQLKEVHHLRNNIVHDPDYRLTLDEAQKAADAYEKAFRDLQILGE